MTPEDRTRIDALIGDHATCWTLEHSPFLHQAALDLRAECDRLAAEVERMRAVVKAARRADDAFSEFFPEYPDGYAECVQELSHAIAALDAKEPPR